MTWKTDNLEGSQIEKIRDKELCKMKVDLENSVTPSDISLHIKGIPWEERREKKAKILFEEIIAENVPNLGKEANVQIEEAQRSPNRVNQERSTPRHMVIGMAGRSNNE